jgi:hypothetical protein
MKRVFVIFFIFCSAAAEAQIYTGAKGGISIPNLKGNNEQSKGYTSRKGAYGGLLANFTLTRFYSLQTEINFSPQGGQRKGLQPVPADKLGNITLPPGTTLYANFNTNTIINYIEVPVLLQYNWGNRLKYHILLGPYISFRTESKTKTSGSSLLYLDENGTIPLQFNGNNLPPVSFDDNTDVKNEIKKINAGAQGGVALSYNAGPGYVFIEGRFIRGLINVQTHTKENGKNQTGSVIAAIGYSLKIK